MKSSSRIGPLPGMSQDSLSSVVDCLFTRGVDGEKAAPASPAETNLQSLTSGEADARKCAAIGRALTWCPFVSTDKVGRDCESCLPSLRALSLNKINDLKDRFWSLPTKSHLSLGDKAPPVAWTLQTQGCEFDKRKKKRVSENPNSLT